MAIGRYLFQLGRPEPFLAQGCSAWGSQAATDGMRGLLKPPEALTEGTQTSMRIESL